MTEKEWLSASHALFFVGEAAGLHRRTTGAEDVDPRRLHLAKAACLHRLRNDLPLVARKWVEQVDATPDDAPFKVWDRMCLQPAMYMAFRVSYDRADAVVKQRLAAAQDVYHGGDYYACEEYMLEADESHLTYTGPVYTAESAAHCDIIRCIFGNPFRPVAFSPAWRSESAVALARTAYDTRDFALLPILADALEEAGCDHAEVLNHCRDPKAIHARGCWVVDLVLGRS